MAKLEISDEISDVYVTSSELPGKLARSKKVAVTSRATPIIVSVMAPFFLCLRKPEMLARAVVGRTKQSIQKWKFELLQKVVPKIGRAISKIGVIKQ